jgi:hypothetical protein
MDDYEETVLFSNAAILHRPFGSSRFVFNGQSFAVDTRRMCVKLAADRTGDERLVALLSSRP